MILDQLTKSMHFILMTISYDIDKLVKIYIREIDRLHGVSASIFSNRGIMFTLGF